MKSYYTSRLIAAALLCGALMLAILAVSFADRDLRQQMLLDMQPSLEELDSIDFSSLSGKGDDIGRPEYALLKERLSSLCRSKADCSTAWLMGMRSDGSIFSFADSHPSGSPDVSPPGQAYQNASPALKRVFLSGKKDVGGPFPSLWNGVISGFLPVTDRESGRLIAVLRMDIGAMDWLRNIASRSALPVGILMIVSLGVVTLILLSEQRKDKTSRREHELFESREQYMLAVKGSNDAIWDWNIETNDLFLSSKFMDMTGYKEGQFDGTFNFFEEKIHPEDRDGFHKALHRYLEGESPYFSSEFRFLDAEGEPVWMLVRGEALRYSRYKPYRMAGSISDITVRVKADREVRRRSDFQRVLMELAMEFVNTPLNALDGAVNQALETVGRFLKVDRSYLFRYNFDKGTMSKTYEWCAEGITPAKDNLQNIQVVPEWVETHLGELIVHIPDVSALPENGAQRLILEPHGTLSFIALPLNYGDQCFGFVGLDAVLEKKGWTHEDITLLRVLTELLTNAELRSRHETALIDARYAAEAANRVKSDFLANVSHEIRTPMNGIIGIATLLLDDGLVGEQKKLVKTLLASGEALLTVVSDILDFSKIEAGKLELDTVTFEVKNMIEVFEAIMAVKAREKGLDFACTVLPDVPEKVEGDPDRIRQILNNLTDNAIKFTEKGSVTVKASLEYDKENKAFLRFSVTDTGIGIPSDKHDKLFESFSQVDTSTTREHGGTGLGLAISKQLVEMMGGRIDYTSTEGSGSEFWFTVPLGAYKADSKEETTLYDSIAGTRLLIVDDNEWNHGKLSKLLDKWNLRISEASSAAIALDMLNVADMESDPFRIVLIDMEKPETDGLALGRSIRDDNRFADVSLIMLNTTGSQSDSAVFKEAGISAALSRPVYQPELFNAILDALSSDKEEETVPVSVAADTDDSAPQTDTAEEQSPAARILIVDDSKVNQMVVSGMLRRLGFDLDTASGGQEALDRLRRGHYDLVLMDVQMPEMDGLEATSIIRNKTSAVPDHDIPVIALTAHAMEGDREICLQAGMNDYITKPVNSKHLEETVKKWISGSE